METLSATETTSVLFGATLAVCAGIWTFFGTRMRDAGLRPEPGLFFVSAGSLLIGLLFCLCVDTAVATGVISVGRGQPIYIPHSIYPASFWLITLFLVYLAAVLISCFFCNSVRMIKLIRHGS
jgi:hypothetical protein